MSLKWKLIVAESTNGKGLARHYLVTGFARTPGVEYKYGKIYMHKYPRGRIGYGYWRRR